MKDYSMFPENVRHMFKEKDELTLKIEVIFDKMENDAKANGFASEVDQMEMIAMMKRKNELVLEMTSATRQNKSNNPEAVVKLEGLADKIQGLNDSFMAKYDNSN